MQVLRSSPIAGRSLDSFLGPNLSAPRCQTKINQDGSIIFDHTANLFGSRDVLSPMKSPKMSRDRLGTPTPSGVEIVSLEANKRGSKSSDDFVFAEKVETSVAWGANKRASPTKSESATDPSLDSLTMEKYASTPMPGLASSTPTSPMRSTKNSGSSSGIRSSSKSTLGQKIRKFVLDRRGNSKANVTGTPTESPAGKGKACTSFSNSAIEKYTVDKEQSDVKRDSGKHSAADFATVFATEFATYNSSASAQQMVKSWRKKDKKEAKKAKKAKALTDSKAEKSNKPSDRSDGAFDKYDRYNKPTEGVVKTRSSGCEDAVNARGPRVVVARADSMRPRDVDRELDTAQRRVSGISLKACTSKHGSLSSAIQDIGSACSDTPPPQTSPFPQRVMVLTKTGSNVGNDGMEILDTDSPGSPVQRRSSRFFIAPKDMDVRLVVGDATKLARPTIPLRLVDESRPPTAIKSSSPRPGSGLTASAQDMTGARCAAEGRPTSGLVLNAHDKVPVRFDDVRPISGPMSSSPHIPSGVSGAVVSEMRARRAMIVPSRTAYEDFVGSHETIL